MRVVANSNVKFIVNDNNAQEDKPDGIAVTAYSNEGKSTKVLCHKNIALTPLQSIKIKKNMYY